MISMLSMIENEKLHIRYNKIL